MNVRVFGYSLKSFATLRLCVKSSSESDFRFFGFSVIRLFGCSVKLCGTLWKNLAKLRGKKTYGTTHELGKTSAHNLG
jgi:hypothetical protein